MYKNYQELQFKNPNSLIKSERVDKLSPTNIRVRISKLNEIIRDELNMTHKYAGKRITDYSISASGLYSRIKQLEDSQDVKFEFQNIDYFNQLLNTSIPTALGGGYDIVDNYNEWKKFFYNA